MALDAAELEHNRSLLTTAWVARIIYVVNFIVILKFIWVEYQYRKRNHDHIKHRWLTAFQVLAMISSALLSMMRLFSYIPRFCQSTVGLLITLYGTKSIFITFYQITRLQISFSSESLKEQQYQKYGYNKRTFIALYTTGILLIVCYPLTVYTILPPIENIPHFGCTLICFQTLQFVFSFAGIWYYAWDWTVLIMYIVRIVQITKAITLNNKEIVYHKIKAILKKMILLTICYEVITMSVFILTLVAPNQGYTIPGVILFSVDVMMPVFVIYFMAEHNNDKYLKLMKVCCNCCFCKETNNLPITTQTQRNHANNNGDDTTVKAIGHDEQDSSPNPMLCDHYTSETTNTNRSDSVLPTNEIITSFWDNVNKRDRKHIFLCALIFVFKLFVFIIVLFLLLAH